MKKGLLFALFLAVFVTSISFAGSPDLTGPWNGTGRAILPFNPFPETGEFGPTIVEDIIVCGEITMQDGDLFYGEFELTFPDPAGAWEPITLEFEVNGNVSVNKRIKAIFILKNNDEPSWLPPAEFDGQWHGDPIDGVLVDPYLGGTISINVIRGACAGGVAPLILGEEYKETEEGEVEEEEETEVEEEVKEEEEKDPEASSN